jgi:hypothetical protein
MSSAYEVEAARQRLTQEPYHSPSRVLGYGNRLILRVDYRPGYPPDRIIHEVDPMARPLPNPPTEQGFSTPDTAKTPASDNNDSPDQQAS